MDPHLSKNENYVVDVRATGKVIEAYKACGYEVLLGNPDCLLTKLRLRGRQINASSAVSLTDIMAFQWIAEFAPWKNALVIGNSFGFSTFVIAALSPGCFVDAIDAEVEGSENQLGSEITREVSRHHFPGVRLTIGFSPQDLQRACRFDAYDLIFIDGLHTNEQLVTDFKAIQERRSKHSVVYCHDVGMAKMHAGWARIKSQHLKNGDRPFDLHFTSFGSTAVSSGCSDLEAFLERVCLPLDDYYFYFGARHIGLRSGLSMLWRTTRHSTRLGSHNPAPYGARLAWSSSWTVIGSLLGLATAIGSPGMHAASSATFATRTGRRQATIFRVHPLTPTCPAWRRTFANT